MGLTTTKNIRYPVATDAFNPPLHMKNLAEDVDALINPSVANVAALPSSGNWPNRTILVEDEDVVYLWPGADPWLPVYGLTKVGTFTPTGIYAVGGPAARPVRQNGRVSLEGRVTSSSASFVAGNQYNIGSIPTDFAPDTDRKLTVIANQTALCELTVDTSGQVYIRLNVSFTGALDLSFDGTDWPDKRFI